MRIEIVTGSPRGNSVTKRVALHLYKQLALASSHHVGIIHASEWHLPPLQAVFTSPEATPDDFKPLSERIFNADAFIIVTPEFNGTYTGALKNIFDHFPKQHRKAFGIVTASPGPLGGMRAAQQLLQLVPALFGIASPYLLIVPYLDKKFDKEGELIDENFRNSVHNFTREFLWLAESIAREEVRS
jgi:NAD(P)H-dependent FMN reductase